MVPAGSAPCEVVPGPSVRPGKVLTPRKPASIVLLAGQNRDLCARCRVGKVEHWRLTLEPPQGSLLNEVVLDGSKQGSTNRLMPSTSDRLEQSKASPVPSQSRSPIVAGRTQAGRTQPDRVLQAAFCRAEHRLKLEDDPAGSNIRSTSIMRSTTAWAAMQTSAWTESTGMKPRYFSPSASVRCAAA